MSMCFKFAETNGKYSLAGRLIGRWIGTHWKAARLLAVLLPATVALFALLHHLIAADGVLGL